MSWLDPTVGARFSRAMEVSNQVKRFSMGGAQDLWVTLLNSRLSWAVRAGFK
jgi:hypothetical protein